MKEIIFKKLTVKEKVRTRAGSDPIGSSSPSGICIVTPPAPDSPCEQPPSVVELPHPDCLLPTSGCNDDEEILM